MKTYTLCSALLPRRIIRISRGTARAGGVVVGIAAAGDVGGGGGWGEVGVAVLRGWVSGYVRKEGRETYIVVLFEERHVGCNL